MSDKRWSEFWFLNGGGIHGAFKYRRWTELKQLAMALPKAAWDAQQREIDRLSALLQALSQGDKDEGEG